MLPFFRSPEPWEPSEPCAWKVPIMAITQNAGKEGSVIVEYLLKSLGRKMAQLEYLLPGQNFWKPCAYPFFGLCSEEGRHTTGIQCAGLKGLKCPTSHHSAFDQ